MGRIANVMQECMDDFNRRVRDAMYGDENARAWLISSNRGDSTAATLHRWKTFKEWATWNNSHGGSIRRMVQQASETDRRNGNA